MKAFVNVNQVIQGMPVTLKIRGVRAFKWKLRVLRWLIVIAVRIIGLSGKIRVELAEQEGGRDDETGV